MERCRQRPGRGEGFVDFVDFVDFDDFHDQARRETKRGIKNPLWLNRRDVARGLDLSCEIP